jgi:putative heme-binding domain-containing protein
MSRILSILLVVSLAACGLAQDPGKEAVIPDAWRAVPAVKDGYGWYLGVVKTPENWADQDWTLIVEAVDDAREVFIDGKRIGSLGVMPPQFRSGLGETARMPIRPQDRAKGSEHVVAIRVFYRDGRTNFNVAAPVLFAGKEAIRLAGKWRSRPGDDVAWAKADAKSLNLAAFEKIESAAEVEQSLKKLAADEGPLSPQESMKRLSTPTDLQLTLALADPDIAQPLSMKWDARGRLWVVEYRQYPTPAGLTAISRDKFLRTVYDKVPPAPPNHFRGEDRVTIHEDTDGDGYYEAHKTFVDGLSLATSMALDRDGVWVLNPPYLLFYKDANHDDQPDGDPEVHLEGFGIEDSHSIASNLRFGPDGWLYGAQGSTVTGDIRRPGEKQVVHSLGQLIWRYHPQQRKYEVFAEGGGNTFGVEIDSAGRIFSGHNGGDTRGFHYVQGGYSQKGFGKHGELSNPFTFGYFPAMKHPAVPRFTHCFAINEDDALGEKYRGRMFAVAPLQGHVIISKVERDGSSFQTHDEGYAITSTDSWCRPVDVQQGPDGAIYVADMYEQRIDHGSHYQGRIHTTSGRIYRISAAGSKPAEATDLTKRKTSELIELLTTGNHRQRQLIQELLRTRQDVSVDSLKAAWRSAKGTTALELFWAMHRAAGLDDALTLEAIKHAEPQVRRWAVQLACNDGEVSPELATELADLAYREADIEVRSQLAQSARRLPVKQSLAIVARLLRRGEDASDVQIPLLLWWAVETHCAKHREEVLALLGDKSLWDEPLVRDTLLERVMKRFAQAGTRADLAACAKLLTSAPTPDLAKKLLAGLETSLQGRSLAAAPPELAEALAKYGGGSLMLRLRNGDAAAIAEAIAAVADEKGDVARRVALIGALPVKSNPQAAATLLTVAKQSRNDEVRGTAISALGSADGEETGRELAALHEAVSDDLRLVIQNVLAGRVAWAKELVRQVEVGKITAERVSPVVVRKLRLLGDAELTAAVSKLWGESTGPSPEVVAAQLKQFEGTIAAAVGNPYSGRKLFADNCGKCHTLFNQGGKIGPDLTAYKRDDLRGILMHVLQPSLEIREGFETFLVQTDDGRQLSGFIADQDSGVVVLRGVDGKNVVVPRDTIEDMRAAPVSLMPEGLLKDLSAEQVRDLFAYVRATQPLPD